MFVWEADPTLVGTTIYFKFTSFNRMGLMEQSLANATAYSFAFNGIFGNMMKRRQTMPRWILSLSAERRSTSALTGRAA